MVCIFFQNTPLSIRSVVNIFSLRYRTTKAQQAAAALPAIKVARVAQKKNALAEVNVELFNHCHRALLAGENRDPTMDETMRLYGYFTIDPDTITKAYQKRKRSRCKRLSPATLPREPLSQKTAIQILLTSFPA